MRFIDLDKMTRFERARIISARALQIAMGAPPLIDRGKDLDPIKTAREEFEKDVVPLSVKSKKPAKKE
ncbi:MAG: DNA-directed RNA polymerase subunit K [Candidatus Aenigmatarchaeota archaeon]